jgi:hypothetical protein
MGKYGRAREATDDNMVQLKRFACQLLRQEYIGTFIVYMYVCAVLKRLAAPSHFMIYSMYSSEQQYEIFYGTTIVQRRPIVAFVWKH